MSVILVVEDATDTADMYSVVLMSKGHTVIVAESIAQAIEKAYTHKGTIDVLVTDLHLQDGLGTEFPKLLGKRMPKSSVLITGRDPFPSTRYQGFDDYLIKPIDCENMCKTVQNCIDLHAKEDKETP